MYVRMNAKGQIVIPANIRRKYGIKSGTRMIFTESDGVIIIRPVTERDYLNLQGSLKGLGAFHAFLEEREKERSR